MRRTIAFCRQRHLTVGTTPPQPVAAWPIVVVTTFFPNSVERQRTVFVKNLVNVIRSKRDVTVIAPVPWHPWPMSHRKRLPPRGEVFEGIPVRHPRFLVIPGVAWLSGVSYFIGVLRILTGIRSQLGEFILHAHCAYPDGVGVVMASRWLGLPCVVTAHGSDINVYAARHTLRPQVAWALGHASAVIAVSRPLGERVASLVGCGGIEPMCIPCAGFDPSTFGIRDRVTLRAVHKLCVTARVAVFVGQLVSLKQVDRLIEAWGLLHARGEVRSVDRLIIVGSGPEGARLKQQIQALGLDELVLFAGVLPQSGVSDWVSCADLLCLPSRIEGLPNVVVEALASGVPVVASRVGGIPDLVSDGVNGFLVPAGDSNALAEGLHRCFARQWDSHSLRRSVEHLTWNAIAERNLELIDRITERVDRASLA